jgi:uncharacterized membrane protein YfcA
VELLFVLVVGLVAGTIGGIVGFGASILLMPVLVIVHGPLHAVPIMAVAALLANASRIVVWWRDVQWRAAAAWAVTGAPCAGLGAHTLLALPPRLAEVSLGAFFIAMVPIRRWMAARDIRLGLWHLALLAAPIGFVTGIVVSTGPVTAPLFIAHGLARGAFISTEAVASLAVYLSKTAVFQAYGALPADILVQGLVVGSSLMVGSFLAKRFVLRMSPERFRLLMDALMVASGLTLLWTALR